MSEMWLAVRIMPKSGVRNPEGEAVLTALSQLGFAEVKEVRQGKTVLLDVDCASADEGRKMVKKMCETLLVNGTIEQFEITAA